MKTMVYWVGLILVGLGIWGVFFVLWITLPITSMRSIARHTVPITLIVGVIIFLAIGLRMMKESKSETGDSKQRE